MDPITHGVVGLAVGTLSGQPFSMDNPVYWAALLGSQLPDFDILCQIKGDYFYLKNHRGVSHSLPGIFGASMLGVLVLLGFFPEAGFLSLWVWILAGAFSHCLLDILNSYGAQILWPWRSQMVTANLLPLADPVLLLMGLGALVLSWGLGVKGLWLLPTLAAYLALRWFFRRRALGVVWQQGEPWDLIRVVVHPAAPQLGRWDFLAEGLDCFLVGQVRLGRNPRLVVRRRLAKEGDPELIQAALESPLGKFFRRFTPHCYATSRGQEVHLLDLRYFVGNDFLHHGTAFFDEQLRLTEAFFQPYRRERKVRVG